jgi:multidrug efflux pump subunit AcrA (membrane-fusion protein)
MRQNIRTWTLALVGALLLFFCFWSAPKGMADRGVQKVLTAVAATGPSNVLVFTEQDEANATLVFQFHAAGSGAAKIEYSIDHVHWKDGVPVSGTAAFSGTDDIRAYPVCGGCVFRANATTASAGNEVTVTATLSGSRRVLVVTFTPTPTVTPTHV